MHCWRMEIFHNPNFLPNLQPQWQEWYPVLHTLPKSIMCMMKLVSDILIMSWFFHIQVSMTPCSKALPVRNCIYGSAHQEDLIHQKVSSYADRIYIQKLETIQLASKPIIYHSVPDKCPLAVQQAKKNRKLRSYPAPAATSHPAHNGDGL